LRQVYFELRDLTSYVRHASNDVAGQQAQREFVRVVQNNRIVDGQAERGRDRCGRRYRALAFLRLHTAFSD
jgi:hypothetical protein